MSLTRLVQQSRVRAVISLITLLTGCSQAANEDNHSAVDSSSAVASEKHGQSSTADSGITANFEIGLASLSMADETHLKKWLALQQGRVVLIDFWATWCGPCMEQLTHTAELSRQHASAGLSVVGVSMDNPESLDLVREALTEKGVTFPNILTEYGAGSKFVTAFDLRGDIPFYRLYDRTGKLRYEFSNDPEGLANGESIEKMDGRIQELLAESSSTRNP